MHNWLWEQLLLTGVEIKKEVTIPHIITGIIMYCIVHSASKRGTQSAEKVFKSHMQRLIHRHVHDRHGGHPLKCEHPACDTTVRSDSPEPV